MKYEHKEYSLGFAMKAQPVTCECNGACPLYKALQYPSLMEINPILLESVNRWNRIAREELLS